ncbi:ATP-binding cassette subfamily B protein [Chitinophaga niastensis]|uniref:ATP-binding cassette subfamily B protein n=1 Tax=Chitinophaga niastensis TaxID=536980 RepID=A0A2P8HEP1_CHINA|nr:peptidase domain-containing ABC transporter [Chitinophaga niastensis]PSL44651.1 ATP-binding cassette subfamily B protein [Chitinophaga niastensis]
MRFPFYKQHDTMDCGPTCIRMIATYYGKNFPLQKLRELSDMSREGVSFLGLSKAAEAIGLKTRAVRLEAAMLVAEVPLPCIIHWKQSHFVVLYKISKGIAYIADPGKGLIKYTWQEFLQGWMNMQERDQSKGVALLFETTPAFYNAPEEKNNGISFSLIFQYLKKYKKLLFQLVIGLLASSLLQLLFPFLTQVIVDVGLHEKSMHFIYLILFAQLFLFIGKTSIEVIRSWILLHISTRVNISILSDFLIKLMKLPLSFFDTKMFGDILQRINDHHRIERFLTSSTLNLLFSFMNLLIFAGVLLFYNVTIFIIFIAGSALYVGWVTLFLKRRRSLDYKAFELNARNQSTIVQLIGGMQEIKLNNCEVQKRWEWENIQASLFRFNLQGLKLSQYQQTGGNFINEMKNILITFFSASLVLSGDITLGTMLAIQYIIGQLNNPIEQFVEFMTSVQDARISIERMNEIHQFKNEEEENKIPHDEVLTADNSIKINHLSFRYPGVENNILKDISMEIPENKITAIVGTSGSGKTTLIKLLLKFYQTSPEEVTVNTTSLENIRHSSWRSNCGAVLQDGFIFSDTIASNIAVGEEVPDKEKLLYAAGTANILSFIQSLPLGFSTKIGAEGNGISQGQKQRILIARAIYKNPRYLFFDEATNALDANNEKIIMENLHEFFKGRTVVVVAHRLSTVKHADQIIVINQGKIVERGTHTILCEQKGQYYELVKNQLELGN